VYANIDFECLSGLPTFQAHPVHEPRMSAVTRLVRSVRNAAKLRAAISVSARRGIYPCQASMGRSGKARAACLTILYPDYRRLRGTRN
jgi:hypothetical protein